MASTLASNMRNVNVIRKQVAFLWQSRPQLYAAPIGARGYALEKLSSAEIDGESNIIV